MIIDNIKNKISPYFYPAQLPLVILATKQAQNAWDKAIENQFSNLGSTKNPKTVSIAGVINARFYPNHITCGPTLGAPAAVIALEPFLSLGINKVFLISICGGIPKTNMQIEVGDIILPTEAIREEGTSVIYGSELRSSYQWFDTESRLEASLSSHSRVHQGPIWSTDALYLETESKVSQFSSMGAIGVDMEFSAILQLCKLYSAELTTGFVVSDITLPRLKNGISNDTFKKGIQTLCNEIAALV